MRIAPSIFLTLAATLGLTAAADAQILPGAIQPGTIGISLKTVAGSLTAPVGATTAPGDTHDLFVVDQTGKIYIIHDGVLQSTPLLDISSVENTLGLNGAYDERGLLGLAFSPGFSDSTSSGYHTLYTYQSEKAGTATADFGPASGTLTNGIDHQNVLVQWKVNAANPNVVDMSSRKDLIREDHPAGNHNGGTVAFGPDGDLYLAIGDGGSANDTGNGHLASGNAQSLTVIMGKMLRIDPTGSNSTNGKYGIPSTNPFVGVSGDVPEIYAYGFRNPFKFSFDSATGNLIVGDVGQNNVEEVDQVTSGGNYGWATKEGTFRFNRSDGSVGANSPGLPAGLIDPLVEYDHTAGQAVIGGFVYHGSLLPQLDGDYVFGDLSGSSSGQLFYSDLSSGQIKAFKLSAAFGKWLKGFGLGPDGEIYVMAGGNEGPSGTSGVVQEITPGSIWTGANGTSWSVAGNWSGVVPGATTGTTNTDTASFIQSAANSPLVIDTGGRNVQNIVFTTANVSPMTIGTTSGPALLLTSGGSIQTTSSVVNPQIVNAPLLLEGSYSFTSNAAGTGATLSFGGGIKPGPTSGTTTLTLTGSNAGNNTISGALADNGGGKLAVTKTGGGLWVVSGVNSYTGDTTVSAGSLKFATTTGTPSVGATATATVAAGATLELAGLVSNLGRAGGNRVHVVNNSTAPGLLVSGKNQVIGAIDGAGSVQINAGSDLTANHIIQTALVIGGAAGASNQGRLTIDPSDASGNPLDQSSAAAFTGSLDTPLADGSSSSLVTTADGLSGSASPVPEPATLVLVLLGLALLACGRRASLPLP